MFIKLSLLKELSKASTIVLLTAFTLTACSSNDDAASTTEDPTEILEDATDAGSTDADSDGDGATDTDGAGSTDADSDGDGATDTDGDGSTDADSDGDGTTDTDGDGSTDANTDGDGVVDAGTDGEGTNGDDIEQLAFTATASFPTGQIERISLSDGYVVNGTYPATESDIRVETDGETIYQLGRFQLDSLTKFDAIDTSVVNYQYSLNGEETAVNPSDVIFVNETKAYVLRYGSPTIWIINPSAQSEEEFKIGEMDISAYDPDTTDTDLSPKADSAVIVDGKLFVLMQRLTGFDPIETGYVAVFDVETDTEIDTGKGQADELKGIPLGSLNPTNIRYNESTDEIYVTGRGNIFVAFNNLPGDPYSGGLFAIDQTTYDSNQLLDDGDESTNNGQGFIERTLVLNDDKGYVSFYTGSDPVTFASITSLRTFNPSTGEVGEIVSAVEGQAISTLNLGSDATVWVGINSDTPGFTRLDPTTDMAVEPSIATSFSPINVIFLDKP